VPLPYMFITRSEFDARFVTRELYRGTAKAMEMETRQNQGNGDGLAKLAIAET
jgi:hypothetical protein